MPHIPRAADGRPGAQPCSRSFPEMFPGPLGVSLVGQALEAGIWSLATVPIREFGLGRTAPSMTRRPAAAPAW